MQEEPGLQMYATVLSFNVGTGDPNLISRACTASSTCRIISSALNASSARMNKCFERPPPKKKTTIKDFKRQINYIHETFFDPPLS